MNIKEAIERVVNLKDLKEEEMVEVMAAIMSGEVTPIQIAAFITALRIKGETIDAIVAAAKVMKEKAIPLSISDNGGDETEKRNGVIVDIVGTGGDKMMTFNISTAAAFVVAGGGVKVAKHGNRSVSSRCGSADVLERLGVNINASPEAVAGHIRKIGIGFLFAPIFHTSMMHAAAPRREIGIRTVFNMLGPLTNPLSAGHLLVGVYERGLCRVFAGVLKRLGAKRAMVVHGSDGMDEISVAADTEVVELKGEEIKGYTIRPEDYGVTRVGIDELRGGAAEENANILKAILSGEERGAKRLAVLLNAAAGFYVAGKMPSIKEAMAYASYIIDSKRAIGKLDELIEASKG
jgi:anthranilate phosphoribosyltransferase